MNDKIVHRGPDDSGYFTNADGCAIGMRRLSIIDLATGKQPIPNEDESAWVVFNGEIYNYKEIRDFLEHRGHRFRTQSDTEALVHLYEEEGVEGIARLRGMFAYAIWDQKQQSLLVARDRFGKKPLYYTVQNGALYFASELKCFRGLDLDFTIDEEAIALYFEFRYIPDPWSPFTKVKKLPPAHWLRFDSQRRLTQGRYWRLPPQVEGMPPGRTEEQAREQLLREFDEAVRVRMMADVPLGAFLSGGFDSGAVVASMAMQSKDPVKTFSVGFAEASHNELDDARRVAERYRTDHHEVIIKPDAVSLLPRIARMYDEPFGDPSALPTLLVSEFAVQHVKVALSGDGGDEMFAGYDDFIKVEQNRRLDAVPQFARTLLRWVGDALPYSAYGKNFVTVAGQPTPLMRYFLLHVVPYQMRRHLLQSRWVEAPGEERYRQLLPDALLPGEQDVLRQALYFEATAKLTGDMLVKVDRASMAASLEVRSPLMDHKLAEFAAGIPIGWKIRDGVGKYIFREAMRPRLPAEHYSRPKRGFGLPLGSWFRNQLRPMVEDLLLGQSFADRNIVNRNFLRYVLDEHFRGRRDNYYEIWLLLMFEMWFRDWESEPGFSARWLPSREVALAS